MEEKFQKKTTPQKNMVNFYLVKFFLNMKLLNYFFFILVLVSTNLSKADDRNNKLNKFFKELKVNNKDLAYNIEQKIHLDFH